MEMMRYGRTPDPRMAPAYSVRVRGMKHLWGSAGILQDLEFAKPPILHLENDPAGALITVTTRGVTAGVTLLGTLEPGECLSVSLNAIAAVRVECATDTVVHCLIC